ncbi:MAG: hypothetical protein FWD68_00555 [Alphaproteobacteria bacterium]|nr:hypothetical protein [Alphaproteobacteria bacterium]
MRVEASWKADIESDITVNTSTTGAVGFQVGKDYLIFVHSEPNGERTTIDMGDRLSKEADAAWNRLCQHGRNSQLQQN